MTVEKLGRSRPKKLRKPKDKFCEVELAGSDHELLLIYFFPYNIYDHIILSKL